MKNFKILALLALGLLLVFFFLSKNISLLQNAPASPTPPISPAVTVSGYETQINEEANITVTVKPILLAIDQPPSFEITFTTHLGSMDFAVEKIAVLTDGKRTNYDLPVWEGSPPGGHHRSGTLTFKKPLANAGPVSLVLQNIAEVPVRKFTWQIP